MDASILEVCIKRKFSLKGEKIVPVYIVSFYQSTFVIVLSLTMRGFHFHS